MARTPKYLHLTWNLALVAILTYTAFCMSTLLSAMNQVDEAIVFDVESLNGTIVPFHTGLILHGVFTCKGSDGEHLISSSKPVDIVRAVLRRPEITSAKAASHIALREQGCSLRDQYTRTQVSACA